MNPDTEDIEVGLGGGEFAVLRPSLPMGCGVGAALCRSLWRGTAATESSSAPGGIPARPV